MTVFTTNFNRLFTQLSEEEKQRYYNATRSERGNKEINKLKNKKLEAILKNELKSIFPNSKIFKKMFETESMTGKNNYSLHYLGISKYEIYLHLKSRKLL